MGQAWETVKSQGKTVYHRRTLPDGRWLTVSRTSDGKWQAGMHYPRGFRPEASAPPGLHLYCEPVANWRYARLQLDSLIDWESTRVLPAPTIK